MGIKHQIGKLIIPIMPVTRHVFNHIRWEFNALNVRLNNRFNPSYIKRKRRIQTGHDLSVNVGCGPFGQQGWINLDLMPMPGLSLRHDSRKGLPLAENSAARIRCEHFFEHLDYQEEVPRFLNSCLKCLNKGGVLRIVVPDAEKYLIAYQTKNPQRWHDLGWDLQNLPSGFHTQMDIINHVFRQGEEHHYAYDFETLRSTLEQSGFTKVVKTEYGESVDRELCDDQPNHQPYSLYVDAIK